MSKKKTFEVQTPVLKTVVDGCLSIFTKAVSGQADVRQAAVASTHAMRITKGVEVDLRVRLAKERLAKLEA